MKATNRAVSGPRTQAFLQGVVGGEGCFLLSEGFHARRESKTQLVGETA